MKTAYDIVNRFFVLDQYLDTLISAKRSVSTFNEEFGEGNPEVGVLERLSRELQDERDELENKLKSIEL